MLPKPFSLVQELGLHFPSAGETPGHGKSPLPPKKEKVTPFPRWPHLENRGKLLGGRFGYFYFSCLGEGKGESEAPGRGGGGQLFIENPTKGGALPGGGGCARGREGLQGMWGGGGKYSFSGPKFPPRLQINYLNWYFHCDFL